MALPTPTFIIEAFAINGEKNTIPVASQIPITPGAASYNDGFPPLNMTPITSGGIPPAGKDMNGVLFELSSNIAWLCAGNGYSFNADKVTATGGYELGATLRSVLDPTLYFFNVLAANTNDPDDDPTGWVAWRPSGSQYLPALVPAGTTNNYTPTDFSQSVGTMDLNPSLGDAVLTGLAAGVEGQRIVVSNVHAVNTVTLNALDGGSSADNQFRCAADITLLPQMTIQIQYSQGASKWIVIP